MVGHRTPPCTGRTKIIAIFFGGTINSSYLCNRKSELRCVVRTVRYWSAKPLKAVRLRHAPLSTKGDQVLVTLNVFPRSTKNNPQEIVHEGHKGHEKSDTLRTRKSASPITQILESFHLSVSIPLSSCPPFLFSLFVSSVSIFPLRVLRVLRGQSTCYRRSRISCPPCARSQFTVHSSH